ncbi:MAG: hypothetical protein CMO01_19920 [Thalassobius sp.]|nr:hypothetical protein [Thalassovita sp.]
MKKIETLRSKILSNLSKLMMVAILAGVLFSCNDDEDDITDVIITEEEAAEVITKSVEAETAGIVVQVEEAAAITITNFAFCGYEGDTVFTYSNPSGSTVTYDYSFGWDYALTCVGNGQPSAFDFSYTGSGSYDAPRLAASNSIEGAFEVTGLDYSSDELVFSMDYTEEGSQESKVQNQNSFSSKSTLSSSNITVDKDTYEILSGTVAVEISGDASGNTFSYKGTLTFNGNQSATLVLNSGTTYTIQW